MKQLMHSAGVLLVCLLLQACSSNGACDEQLKTLDSLSGAINIALLELQRTDTVILQKAITRFSQYRQFIQQNINDTVDRTSADDLRRFYNSGKNLEAFDQNRISIHARALLINSQLLKLATDIRNDALSEAQAAQYIRQEKNAIQSLVNTGALQRQIFYSGIEEFKASLRGVEQLIRSHNSGELPTIIKDTAAL